MRLIITGGTGFVGRHLLRSLDDRHEVICLSRAAPQGSPGSKAQIVVADLARDDWARRLPRRVDAVIHLAQGAGGFPEHARELFAVNTASTAALADYAATAGASAFVLVSTGSVYRPQPGVISESMPVDPIGFYATTKAMAEMVLRPYAELFAVQTLRLFAPYGPGQANRMIPRIIAAVHEGETITLYNGGEPRLNPIHVADLVEIIEAALALDGSNTVNVAGPETVGVEEIARVAGEALGREPVTVQVTRPGTADLIADTELMTRLFPRRLLPASAGIAQLAREMYA